MVTIGLALVPSRVGLVLQYLQESAHLMKHIIKIITQLNWKKLYFATRSITSVPSFISSFFVISVWTNTFLIVRTSLFWQTSAVPWSFRFLSRFVLCHKPYQNKFLVSGQMRDLIQSDNHFTPNSRENNWNFPYKIKVNFSFSNFWRHTFVSENVQITTERIFGKIDCSWIQLYQRSQSEKVRKVLWNYFKRF